MNPGMRLFKFLVIATIIGSLYFYAQHQSGVSESWYTTVTASGISIQFPERPASKTFNRIIKQMGNTRLTTYQLVVDNQVLVLLSALPEDQGFLDRPLEELEDIIHHVNDTTHMKIRNKRNFVQQSYRGIEYLAVADNGSSSWCRTVKRNGRLHSVITVTTGSSPNKQLTDAFFRSLRL